MIMFLDQFAQCNYMSPSLIRTAFAKALFREAILGTAAPLSQQAKNKLFAGTMPVSLTPSQSHLNNNSI